MRTHFSTLFGLRFGRRLFAVVLWVGLVVFCGVGAQGQESVYSGAFGGGTGSLSNAIDFETNSGKGLSIINFFKPWSNGASSFPTSAVDGIRNHGSIPMVTWQPNGGGVADDTYKLSNIINGNFDSYIQQWALDAKAWGHPFFLRFAHEMNGTWYPWSPGVNGNTLSQYAQMWQHVHDIFVLNGATNVTWVWCVSTNYSGSSDISKEYPGDNYVDWISVDSYNRITNSWGDFSSRTQDTLDQMVSIAPGKPIMVAETGCHEDDTDVNRKGQWYRNAMASYLKYSAPRIKAWVYFNGNNPDGNDWRITTSDPALAGYQFSIGLSYYSSNVYGAAAASPIQPLLNDASSTDTMPPFVSLVTPAIGTVQAGVVTELRVLASDKSGVSKVTYAVNGVLAFTAQNAPYQYFWTVPAGTGKSYTIVAKAYDAAGNTATSTIQVVSANPPSAPTGVAASDGVYTAKVRVTWSSVSGALGYQVWRSSANDSSTAVQLTTDLITTTTYDDSSLGSSNVNYYWVKTVDATGPSAFSVSDSGYGIAPAAPAVPTAVYAGDGDYNDGTLVNWTASSRAVGYEVWRNTVSSTATATKVNASLVTGTSYYDTTGAYAQGYYYWVRAVNDGGTSAFSTPGYGYRGNLPTISAVADTKISPNTNTGPLALTIGDNETAATALTLASTSSNTTLVPTANIVFGGSGASRTVTITPASNQSGTATITVIVTDADGGQASASFVLTVNTPPTISTVADVSISSNTNTGAIAFTVGDAETAATALMLVGTSSNTTLVPAANIVFGGSGASRAVTVTPASNQSGTAIIGLTVSDGTSTTSTSFAVTVAAPTQVFWTAVGTGAVLPWSSTANWSSGVTPASNVSIITYLAGSTLPAGTINSYNDQSTAFALNVLTLAGTGPATGAGTVNITGGSLNFAALGNGTAPTINLSAAAGAGTGAALTYNLATPISLGATTATFQGDGTATFIASGNITGTGGIVKTGNSTLVLSGASTYAGNTIISGGTSSLLRVTSAAGLGTGGALQVNTGATNPLIQLHVDGTGSNGAVAMSSGFGGNSSITTTIDVANNGSANTGNTIQLNGTSTGWGNATVLNVTGANGYSLSIAQLRSTGGSVGVQTLNPTSAPLTLGTYLGANKNTTLTLDGTNAGNAVTGAIVNGSAVVSVVKSNTGTWVLSGDSTYTGTTTVSAGTLQLGNGGTTGSIAAASAISGVDGTTLIFNRSDSFTLGSVITGAIALKQNGSGNTSLSGANSFTGTTTIGAGTLTISNGAALGTTAGATSVLTAGGQLALTGGISVAEPITLYGKNSGDQLVNTSGGNLLSGAITLLTGGNSYFVRSDADKLTISGSLKMSSSTASKILNFSGVGDVEVSGAIGNDTGTLGITKTGTGILTLSGANTYSGATMVTAGTLAVNSSLTATSGLTVAAAGTLAGTGTIGVAATINGTHAPGAGIGAQAFSAALTYGASSHLAWGLIGNIATGAGTNFDAVNAGSVIVASGAVVDVVLNGAGSVVNFGNSFWQQSHTWAVLTATSVGGTFALGTVSNDAGNRVATTYGLFSLQKTSTAVSVLWTPFTPLQAWQYSYFGANWNNAAVAGDNADPDGDGLPNLLEYALGKSPVSVDRAAILAVRSNGNFVLTYPFLKSATDITLLPEWSADLKTWSTQGITQQVLSDDGTIQTIQATVSTGTNSRMFVRLRATRP